MPAIAQPLGQPMIADGIVPWPPAKDGVKTEGGNMTRPRAADDFAAIRARIEELRRQRAQPARDDGRCRREDWRRGKRAGRAGPFIEEGHDPRSAAAGNWAGDRRPDRADGLARA